MTGLNVDNRTIFCHDNLDVMQGINSNSVDLIYLDPPFNKNKKFTAPVGSSASGAYFDDIFREEDVKDEWLQTIKEDQPSLYAYLEGIKGVGKPYNFAYLAYMAIRLLECHRILKATGSIYLHCDPTMSHYLKTTMDCIFGEDCFRNEIIWWYEKWTDSARCFQRNNDVILFYANGEENTFFKIHGPFTDRQKALIKSGYNLGSSGGKTVVRVYDRNKISKSNIAEWEAEGRAVYDVPDPKGKAISAVWQIAQLNGQARERTGYPTQKPLALLERIIKASSNEADLVLDPFCGCATTCVAAERLGRKWVGIDTSRKAYDLVKERLIKEAADPEDLLKYKNEIDLKTEPPKRTDQGDDHREQKWVCVISHPSYPGEYKVGIARDPKARLNQYQTGSPDRAYKIDFQYQTPAFRETEDHIHTQFDNKREWVTGDLEAIINAIKTFKP